MGHVQSASVRVKRMNPIRKEFKKKNFNSWVVFIWSCNSSSEDGKSVSWVCESQSTCTSRSVCSLKIRHGVLFYLWRFSNWCWIRSKNEIFEKLRKRIAIFCIWFCVVLFSILVSCCSKTETQSCIFDMGTMFFSKPLIEHMWHR